MYYQTVGFYFMGTQVMNNRCKRIAYLAEQLLQTETQDSLTHKVHLLYHYVGKHFWLEEALMQAYRYPDYPTHPEAQELMFDKLIELCYRIHKEEHHNGYFAPQAPLHIKLKDELDFERYLQSLQS